VEKETDPLPRFVSICLLELCSWLPLGVLHLHSAKRVAQSGYVCPHWNIQPTDTVDATAACTVDEAQQGVVWKHHTSCCKDERLSSISSGRKQDTVYLSSPELRMGYENVLPKPNYIYFPSSSKLVGLSGLQGLSPLNRLCRGGQIIVSRARLRTTALIAYPCFELHPTSVGIHATRNLLWASYYVVAVLSRAYNLFDLHEKRGANMSDSPMTEDQGDRIIQLLKDILWELKNGSIQSDVSSIQSDVSRVQSDVSSIQTDVASIDANQ
jgi:hypothetical protein